MCDGRSKKKVGSDLVRLRMDIDIDIFYLVGEYCSIIG